MARPLSPHLSIYRPQITSVISILHRITGIALYAGLGLVVIFLVVVGYFPDSYGFLHGILSSGVGGVLLLGWTFSLYMHFFSGIRHLFWDMGKGFDIPSVHRSGWVVIVFTLIATVVTWLVAYSNAGAL